MDNEQDNNKQQANKYGLLYPELSYKIIGFVYKINDLIGFGQSEKIYCDALEELLKENNLEYSRELYFPIKLNGKLLAKRFFDFLVDDKIILEIKVGDLKYKETCSQLFQYLKLSGKKLGLIFRFTKNGVKIKRIPCFY